MISLLLGLAIGLAAMWLFSRLCNHDHLADIKTQKRAQMKKALKHEGSFSESRVPNKHSQSI